MPSTCASSETSHRSASARDAPLLDQRDGFPGSVVALPVADRDGRTAISERDRDRAADTARAASHDGDTAFETQCP